PRGEARLPGRPGPGPAPDRRRPRRVGAPRNPPVRTLRRDCRQPAHRGVHVSRRPAPGLAAVARVASPTARARLLFGAVLAAITFALLSLNAVNGGLGGCVAATIGLTAGCLLMAGADDGNDSDAPEVP